MKGFGSGSGELFAIEGNETVGGSVQPLGEVRPGVLVLLHGQTALARRLARNSELA
jgi:hypothetical protein